MIQLDKIIIEGFCSIPHLELSLNTTGINILRAPNGYGKSTLLSAIVWALYGKNIKGISDVNTWDRYRPKDYQGTRVDLYYRVNHSTHKIIRCSEYKGDVDGAKGKNRLIYYIDAQQISEKGKNNIQAKIEEDLGISYRVFLNSVMFGQGLKRLIQESNSDQKGLFEEIFNLNYIPKARDLAFNLYKDYNDKYNSLKSDESKVTNSIKLIQDSLDEVEEHNKNIKTQNKAKIKEINDEIDVYKSKVSGLQEILDETDIDALDSQIESLKDKQSDCRSSISEAKKKTGYTIEELVDMVYKLIDKKKYDEAKSKLKSIKDQFSEISINQDKLEKYRQEENQLFIKRRKLLEVSENIKKYNIKIDYLKRDKDRYKDAPLLKIDASSKEKLLKYKEQLKSIKSSLEQAKNKLDLYKWAYSVALGNQGIKAFIFDNSLEFLNNNLKAYSEILGFNIYYGIDLKSTKKDFVVNITMDGIEVVYEELSGGQKQLVCLAMALAMNQVVSKSLGINIAFLDEIFESLSSDNIDIVINLIRKIYKDKTLFLITHQESLPIGNARTITVKKEKGLSYYET